MLQYRLYHNHHNHHNHDNNIDDNHNNQLSDPRVPFLCCVLSVMMASEQPGSGAAQRRRQRRLRSWLRMTAVNVPGREYEPLLTRTEDCQGRGGGEIVELHGQGLEDSSSSACSKKRPAEGGLPALAEPPGPQERIQRRTVEQLTEIALMVQILDAPVPQMVGQLAEVLAFFNATLLVLEQVIEVPKMILDQAPQRSSLRDPQLVEQLVDVPVPRSVILARGTDVAGNIWCQVTEHKLSKWEAYWWLKGPRHVQWALPMGYTASPRRYTNTGRG